MSGAKSGTGNSVGRKILFMGHHVYTAYHSEVRCIDWKIIGSLNVDTPIGVWTARPSHFLGSGVCSGVPFPIALPSQTVRRTFCKLSHTKIHLAGFIPDPIKKKKIHIGKRTFFAFSGDWTQTTVLRHLVKIKCLRVKPTWWNRFTQDEQRWYLCCRRKVVFLCLHILKH